MTKTLTAACHCGAVRIGMSRRPVSLTQCTCSICHRYGALWAYCTRKTAEVIAAADARAGYRWGDRSIEFFHCRTCGCLTHYESVDEAPDARIAVNARMLPRQQIDGIRVRTFDGAETWKYLD